MNSSWKKVMIGAGALLISNAAHATATPNKYDAPLARQMASHTSSGWSSVIAHMNGTLTDTQQLELTHLQADVTRHLTLIHSVEIHVPTRNLAKLAALPFVIHLSSDGEVKKFDEFTTASSGANVAFQQYNLTGKGVGVAVIDSGVRGVWDLEGSTPRLTYGPTCIPGDYNPDDLCGHGTHVAGIIAGDGAASTGSQFYHTFYGIARQANIISVRVLDQNGQGSVSNVIAGIQWVVQNRARYNIRVINLSLGHPVGESYQTDPLCQAVEAAWKSGLFVVCAAGNEGRMNAVASAGAPNEGWGTAYGSIQSPANDPYVITVGATKSEDGQKADDEIATYSSRGPSRLDLVLKPDIVAPGNRIISLYSFGSTLYQWNSAENNGLPMSSYIKNGWSGPSADYFILSGTSMAAPVVAGAAALMLQANPTLSPDTLKARLMASADKWTFPDGTSDPCTFGAGYIDIPAALASTITVPAGTYAVSPTLSEDSSGNVSISTSIIAANRSVWGTQSLTDLRSVWGARSVWGTSSNLLSASRSVWGSSVWSDRSVWGTDSSSVDLSSVALFGED